MILEGKALDGHLLNRGTAGMLKGGFPVGFKEFPVGAL